MNLFISLLFIMINPFSLIDFTEDINIDNWKIVDDGVMGGLSSSEFFIDKAGNAIFKGTVSTDNNGGFCSVRYFFKTIEIKSNKTFSIRLKGDGKKYQFRVKSKVSDYYSYIYEFKTTTDWQTIQIPIIEMYASFRGRTLNIPNYDGTSLSEVAFLIGNKENESFQLMIDKIDIK